MFNCLVDKMRYTSYCQGSKKISYDSLGQEDFLAEQVTF